MIFEITIPEKISMNKIYAGMHWRKRQEVADLYHLEMLPLKGKIKVTEYPVTIHYEWHFTGTALDSLNCAFMSKMIEDGLVHAGVLEDDSTKYVRRSVLDSQKSSKYEHDTVVVSVSKYVP